MNFLPTCSFRAEQNPNDIAVTYENKSLTYKQLETHLTQQVVEKYFVKEVNFFRETEKKMPQDILDIYTEYLICQNQHATAIGLANLLNGSLSHDQVTRFLNGNQYSSKELWLYVKTDVRRHEQAKGGVLIIDDAIEEKPYTDENEIVSWHFSHAKGRCVKGVNILSGLIRYGDIALPISYEVITKDLHFCDIKTKKEKNNHL